MQTTPVVIILTTPEDPCACDETHLALGCIPAMLHHGSWCPKQMLIISAPARMQAVDPVLVGKVRAKQYYSDDHDRSRNMGVLLHGDGSFSGQGVVYETLDMSALQDYTVGGVIHIVVNNQVRLTCMCAPALHSAGLARHRRNSMCCGY